MAKVTGFFTEEVLDTVGLNGPGSGACEKCGLYTSCKSPRMEYTGKGEKGILIVGEHPTEGDDNTGYPFSGEFGELLGDKLKKLGISMTKDCWLTTAVRCHPKNHKDKYPTRAEMLHCNSHLMRTIRELKPKHVWLIGTVAITTYYGHREQNTQGTRWRGLHIPDPDHKCYVHPMYGLHTYQKNQKDTHFVKTFDNDLENAVRKSKVFTPPVHVDLSGAKILKKFQDVEAFLLDILDRKPEYLALDFETTGLKPYREKHKLAVISICVEDGKSVAFPYQRPHWTPEQEERIGKLFIAIMECPEIKKIMHNSKYEDMWTREFFAVEMANYYWCTMNAAHDLDSRSEFSGLKFQALIRWGVPDYDRDIVKYLESEESPYNRVMEAPLNDLLLYASIDSLLTMRLFKMQKAIFDSDKFIEKGRAFKVSNLPTMCDLQENGIRLDREHTANTKLELEARITKMTENLMTFEEAKKFQRVIGRPINFGSSSDLATLFFDVLKLDSVKKTGTGAECVDAKVLAELKTPIAKEITAISKLKKINGTYISQFEREVEDDDRIHPFYDLHTTNTHRGSSSRPNFQNIPVREQEAMEYTRGVLMPSWGFRLIDWDYSAMEVRIIACITKCPVLIAYINDPTTDMHRDQAMDSFCFTAKEWEELTKFNKRYAKDIRFHAKNGEVFAWFYGSYYKSSARSLFPLLKELKCIEGTLFDHLRTKGVIRSLSTAYDDFENHLKKVEQRFWDKFKAVKAWQEAEFTKYLKVGHIEQPFGFRIGGWLTRNDICNYPVQGTAFHCLLWALTRLNITMKERNLQSKLIGQIHDCCLGDIHPTEFDLWCKMSHQIATVDIRKEIPFIIVPLDIEFEGGGIDEPWSMKKEFHLVV